MTDAVVSLFGMAFFEVVKEEYGMKNRDVFAVMKKLTPDDWEDITRGFINSMMVGALGIKKTRKLVRVCLSGYAKKKDPSYILEGT